jgi:hypothetical protein
MVRPNTLSLQNDHTTKKQEGDHMSHAYEDTLRTMYNAFAQGDVETVMGLLTDDIEYHISGHSQYRVATQERMKRWASSGN